MLSSAGTRASGADAASSCFAGGCAETRFTSAGENASDSADWNAHCVNWRADFGWVGTHLEEVLFFLVQLIRHVACLGMCNKKVKKRK